MTQSENKPKATVPAGAPTPAATRPEKSPGADLTKTVKASMSNMEAFELTIGRMSTQFQSLLPPSVSVKRFMRVVMTAVSKTPGLLDAPRASLFNACLECAKDGLVPDGKEAVLVPYGGKEPCVKYNPMVGGILKRVRNSGELSSIGAQIVYKDGVKDFRYWTDEKGEHLTYEANPFSENGNNMKDAVGVFAVAVTREGGSYTEVMSKAQVLEVKKKSRSQETWEGPFEGEMWKKAVIRRLSKRLPMSSDLVELVERGDSEFDLTKKDPVENPESSENPKPKSRLNALLIEKTPKTAGKSSAVPKPEAAPATTEAPVQPAAKPEYEPPSIDDVPGGEVDDEEVPV